MTASDRLAELDALLDTAIELVDAEGFDLYLANASMDKQELAYRVKVLAKVRRALTKAQHDLKEICEKEIDG
jgi:hypothetical protein